jgi:6-pyruvoyltetrahydropterin/6-carboxytetrahydropterin synthase
MKTVTKTYGHNLGLSACFRQPRAHSHCKALHGYALEIAVTFGCPDDMVTEQGWVFDFGGLKPLKAWLSENFDHKTLVAADDPERGAFTALHERGIIDMIILEKGVGCENFAIFVRDWIQSNILDNSEDALIRNVRLLSVRVREHGGNEAAWVRD